MEEKSSLSPVSLLVSILKYSIATVLNFLIYGVSLLLVGWLVDPAVWGKVDIKISTLPHTAGSTSHATNSSDMP